MPGADDNELLNALHRPFVLSMDLIGFELKHPGDRLKQALEQPSVLWKIQETIDKEAKLFNEPNFTGASASGDSAKRIALGALQTAGEATWDSIQKSPRFKLLDSSLKDLKSTFDRTPTGILVDQHKMELILVGSALTLGGGFAQYHFRTNDDLAGLYATAVSAVTSKIKIGQLTVGASVPQFVPSKQTVGFKASGGYNFRVVDTKAEFGGKLEHGQLNQIDAQAIISVPLNYKNIDLKLKGSFGAELKRPDDTHSFDTTWKYSLGVEAASKGSRFKASLLGSGENNKVTVTLGAKYAF
jgi:hypothetical protein